MVGASDDQSSTVVGAQPTTRKFRDSAAHTVEKKTRHKQQPRRNCSQRTAWFAHTPSSQLRPCCCCCCGLLPPPRVTFFFLFQQHICTGCSRAVAPKKTNKYVFLPVLFGVAVYRYIFCTAHLGTIIARSVSKYPNTQWTNTSIPVGRDHALHARTPKDCGGGWKQPPRHYLLRK